MDFPPIDLSFNADGCIECKQIFKLTHSVNATNLVLHPDENSDLRKFCDRFKEHNLHLQVEKTVYWGDGDDATYYHYVDIYFSTMPWYDSVVAKDMHFTYNGVDYLVFYVNHKGEMRLMDTKTKHPWCFNPQTLSITKW